MIERESGGVGGGMAVHDGGGGGGEGSWAVLAALTGM